MRTKKSVRRHKTAAQKAAILARYELSGLSARDFAGRLFGSSAGLAES
jgi:hypothetical protein